MTDEIFHIADHTASRLVREKRDVLRQIEEMRGRITSLTSEMEALALDLAAIDRVLTKIGFADLVEKIKPLRKHSMMFPHGVMSTRAISYIKESSDGLSTKEIIEKLAEIYEIDLSVPDVSANAYKRLSEALRRHRRLKHIYSVSDENGQIIWKFKNRITSTC